VTDGAGTTVGAVVALQDITEQRLAEAELHRRATTDAVTGLSNRATGL
jgi:GGDEF domain-containing protein